LRHFAKVQLMMEIAAETALTLVAHSTACDAKAQQQQQGHRRQQRQQNGNAVANVAEGTGHHQIASRKKARC
jgi:hypothetical protein